VCAIVGEGVEVELRSPKTVTLIIDYFAIEGG